MIEDRPNRSTREQPLPIGEVRKRIRSWLRLRLAADPALPRPRPLRLEPIRRSWVGAFWQARISLRAGVSLDDYLRSRLARYLSALQVPRARLPIWIDVEDAQIVAGPHEAERRAGVAAPPAADSWLAALVAAEGPAVRQEVSELELRLAQLEGEADAARRRSEELARRLAADVAAGLVPAPSAVEATPEQLGRPEVRSALPQLALLAFAGLATLAEAWQVAVPLLRGAGLDPSALSVDAARSPVEAAFAAIFGLGIAAGLIGLAHTAVRALDALATETGDERRRAWHWASAIGAALLAALVALALATLPAPATALPAWSSAVLLVALPVGVTLVLRAGHALAERRADQVYSALLWDRERAQAISERARRIEEISWAQELERDLGRQREAARGRMRDISARASAASRLAAAAEQRERNALSRLAQSLVSALELDRYEFVRQATEQGADALLTPRRRPPLAQERGARDGQLSPAVVTVGADRTNGGRMAS